MMKKQYKQPMAEKIEFNYKETIVASKSNQKKGRDNDGCRKGNNIEGGCPYFES